MNQLGPNRKLIHLIIVPLAIYLGWVLSEPLSFGTMVTVGALFGLLLIPILLRWHRPLLFFSWNAALIAFFLPGKPPLWMAIAGAALTIIVLQWIIEKKVPLITVRSLNWTFACILLVVLVTAYVRGGIGLRALGSEAYGGKRYVYIFGAIIGFYALSTVQVQRENIHRYAALFFLGGLTYVVSNLIFFAGPAFYWMFMVFPVDSAVSQIQAQYAGSDLVRLGGLSFAMMHLFYYLLARFPVREMFRINHLWLAGLVAATVAIAMLGGFRSGFVFLCAVFAAKFFLEGLLWTRLFFGLCLGGALLLVITLPLADRMPLSVQRTLSFVPFADVDPLVRMDAWASTEWRLLMWDVLMDDLPNYLLIGKGYVINPTDLYMVEHSMSRGFVEAYEGSLVAGDYHSGPLSVLVNFGIPGALAWLAFCVISLRTLIRNFRHGEKHLKNLNGFVLAFYATKVVFFFLVFGDFATDLYIFTGLLGMSVAINGGMREKPVPPRKTLAVPQLGVHRFENEAALAQSRH